MCVKLGELVDVDDDDDDEDDDVDKDDCTARNPFVRSGFRALH